MKTKTNKNGKLIFGMILIGMIICSGTVFADHNSNASLEPEWSPAGQNVDYTVTFCNDGSSIDAIGEVRIYRNISYTNFVCDDKPGWGKYFITEKQACQYVASNEAYYIQPGECENFTFSATTPQEGCEWLWNFETRDETFPQQGSINYLSDTTSVDDLPPSITKTIGEPNDGNCPPGDNEVCWVTNSTQINVNVIDQGECGISGLDWCRITYKLDGSGPYEIKYKDLNGEKSWDYTFSFSEDSVHVLNITCKDMAGNIVTDIEEFKVDSTPPETTKTVSEPKKMEDGVEWVDTVTEITFTSNDPDPTGHDCNIGVDKTWYKNILACGEDPCRDPAEYCTADGVDSPYDQESYDGCINDQQDCCTDNWKNDYDSWEACVEDKVHTICGVDSDWHLYDGTPIKKETESCHILYYFSVDELGNIEPMQVNCFFVDKTPPIMIKEVGEPSYYEKSNTQTDDLCYKDAQNGWQCYTTLPSALQNLGYTQLPKGMVTYEDCGPFLKITVNLSGLKSDTAYQLTLNGRNGGDGNDKLANNCEFPNAPARGYQYAWGCGYWSGGTGQEGFWNFDMNAVTDGSGNYEKTYFLHMPDGHYGIPANNNPPYGIGFIVKEAADVPGGSNYPPILMETHGLDWTIDKSQRVWVKDHETPITLDCMDLEPHPSGDEEVCYKVSLDGSDVTDEYCDPGDLEYVDQEGYKGQWCCVPAPETIIFKEDSLHDLEYFCRDAVDKKSEIDLEWFKVDSQPPVITKTMIGSDHLGNCPPTGPDDICYVKDDDQNGVHIDVEDNQTYPECAVGVDYCKYGLWWYTDETTCKNKYGEKAWDGCKCLVDSGSFSEEGNIYFTEDSTHELYISCWDLLGNQMPIDVETFKVDSTPPETNKTYGTPFYSDGTYDWITSSTPITLTATDEKVGVDKMYYRITYLGDEMCPEVCDETGSGNWTEVSNDTTEFTINKDSCHLIEFYSIDKLGNDETHHKQCVMVDNTPPEVRKNIGEPQVNKSGKIYITQDTSINIHCADAMPHPVGEDKIFYRYRISDDCQNWGNWTEWFDLGATKKIYFSEDSCHELEYYCVDKLSNKADTQSEIDIVDTQPPEISTSVIGPHYESDGKLYIDGVTKIHVEATDPEPHPVDDVKCDWWYYVNHNPTPIQGGSDLTPPFNISFPEESKHDLWIRCWDALGNDNKTHEVYYVDHTPPVTTKTYGEPYFSTCTSQWITSDTNITLTATDGTSIHASGVNKTWYRDVYLENESDWHYCYSDCDAWTDDERATVWGLPTAPEPYNPSSRGFVLYEGPFTLPNESCHIIEYYSYDNVGKVEKVKHQCVFVDNTPPEPNKTVGDPKTEWDGQDSTFYPEIKDLCWKENGIECWKVTLTTPITLDCIDPEPHPVDHEETCFKVGVDGDDKTEEYCKDMHGTYNESGDGFCCGMNAPYQFYFNEETEHNLEYYCVDALGNKGQVDEEKFKVEGEPFEIQINKKWNLISVPFMLINDNIEEVLKDIKENIESVWTYDPEHQICDYDWCVYTPDGDPSNDNLHRMIPGWGYWVLANNNCTLIIGGSWMRPAVVPPSRTLYKGWNLIGYHGTEGLYGYYGPYGNGNYSYCALYTLRNEESIYPPTKWDALLTYWEPDNPYQWKYFGVCDRMDPGAGYWVHLNEDKIYTRSTVCPGSLVEEICSIGP